MLPTGVRILVCTVPQDMRRSFDGLCAAVKLLLGEEPQNGSIYVFVGKRPSRVKVLWWDRNGFCILAKRLHRALFHIPPGTPTGEACVRIDAAALAQLLKGVAHEPQRRKLLT